MALIPVTTPPDQIYWTITDPAYKASGDNSDFVGVYVRPPFSYTDSYNIPSSNQRVYPAFKPGISHIYVTFDVELSGIYTRADWISFATFSNDTFGTRVLTFNMTQKDGFHFAHTLAQDDNTNDYIKPQPYTINTNFSVVLDVVAGGSCSAWVDSTLVAQCRFLGVSVINLTHYGLYTSPTTQYLKVRNRNLIEYQVA